MKIAVSSEGQDLTSRVDPRFGRARWFVFYDSETDEYESRNNDQNLNLPQGAGIQAAQQVLDRNTEVVITGHCGPNAFRTLAAGGARVIVGVEGTVREAIDKFKRGEIQPAEGPDVEGHW
jgi:predicted Fe-Mo cluster-binding NifX family protein